MHGSVEQHRRCPIDAELPALRAIILLNGLGGTAKSLGKDRLQAMLEEACTEAGIAPSIRFLDAEEWDGRVNDAVEKVRAKAADVIVAGGGDGTIRSMAGKLAGTDIALGILPLGTLNHFAKDVGIPLQPGDAIRIIAENRTRTVDIGEVNGHVFLNNASVGIYPSLVAERERRRRENGEPKYVAMLLAMLGMFRNMRFRSMRIRAEGRDEYHRTPCLLVGNNAYVLTGPSLGSRERLDAGMLAIYVSRQASAMALFATAFKALLGRLDYSRDVRVMETGRASVHSSRRSIRVALDGELKRLSFPLHFSVKPRALKVIVPATQTV